MLHTTALANKNIIALDSTKKEYELYLQIGNKTWQNQKNMPITSENLPSIIQDFWKVNGAVLSNLDLLILHTGPGSYTGLRIGTSFIKGLAMPTNVPIIGVSTLENLAYQASLLAPANTYVVALIARPQEAYVGTYNWDLSCISTETKNTPISLENDYQAGTTITVGDAVFMNSTQHIAITTPTMEALLAISVLKYAKKELVDHHQLTPNYIKEVYTT